MRTANMPAGQGSDPEARDVERLADALDRGGSPDSVDDPVLAHDLRIVELMRVFGPDPTLAPAPDARDRARARLRAAMAEQARAQVPAASPVPSPGAASAEVTARFAARPGGGTAGAVTAEFRRIVADDTADDRGAGAPDVPGAEREDGGTGTGTAPRSRRSRAAAPSRPAGRSRASARPPRGGIRGRAAAVVLASLVALVAVAVGGDLASRGALPGDALYAIKRVSEDVGVATTFDDRARAQRHLALATTRVDEVEQLVERDGAGGADAAVVEGVIADFDASADEGTRTLFAAPEAPGPAELDDLQAWASDQAARLAGLRPALPAPALDQVDGSLALLDRLVVRTRELGARPDCDPLAAEGSCTPVLPGAPTGGAVDDGTGGATGGPGPGGTGTGGTGTGGPTGGGTGRGGGTGGTQDGARPDTGTAPRTPGGGSTAPSTARPAPDEPSGGGLLPGIDTGDLPLLPDGDGPSTPPDEDDGDVSLPLPVLPPVEVPPLLPGQPGLSIG